MQQVLAHDEIYKDPFKNDHTILEALRDDDGLPTHEKTVERLTDEATILVIAASESPAKTLALIHFHLMKDLSIVRKLRNELDLLESAADSRLSLAQLEKAPYLSAVVKEGLRLHGGIVSRSQRVAPTEVLRYKSFNIPPGTPLSTSSFFVHHNEDIFPNPGIFRPERWLDRETSTQSLDRYLVSFGKGTRNCVGINLGLAEIYLTLSTVVRQFDMELFETDSRDATMERDWYVPQPKLGSKGIRALVVAKRQLQSNHEKSVK